MGGVIVFPRDKVGLKPPVAHRIPGLAHDLRNLMTSLELCAEALGHRGVLNSAHANLADDVRAVARTGIALLQRIGEMAEPAAPQLPIPVRPERLVEVLRRLGPLCRAAASRSVRVDFECAPCWGYLGLPEAELGRVLTNLIRNACEAMPEGGLIRVTAQMAGGQSFASGPRAMQAADAVIITVQDNGPGIPGDLAAAIFQPGFTTRRQKPRGKALERGMGLAIAREIAESRGGQLRLAPSIAGARFEIELPLTNVTPPEGLPAHFGTEGGHA
jgi:signal transduction histidine kinase